MILDDYKYYNKGLIYKGAPHMENKLTKKECKIMLLNGGGYFIRNVYNFDCKKETSFWFVIKDQFGGMDELKSKVRNQVKRALKTLDIAPISKETMLNYGYEIYLSSYRRYKATSIAPMSEKIWDDHVKNSSSNIEYWGAFEKETHKLIAYSSNLIQDNMCKYTALKAIPEFLNRHYPFYGLIYLMNKHYIVDRGMQYVTDGARSVTQHSNIQSFLEKFNFRKAYCELSITYPTIIKIIVRIIYPFRTVIPISKVRYLLDFEAMQRGDI
jgi:hypothetical protein